MRQCAPSAPFENYAGGSARSWVLSIVRNTAYSWLRKNCPAAVVTVEDLEAVELEQANPGEETAIMPEAALIAKADAEQLARGNRGTTHRRFARRSCCGTSRALIIARSLEATEVPIGTVMSRLARARHRLIAALTSER